MSKTVVTPEQARAFLIRRQGLVACGGPFAGPEGVLEAIVRLEAVQIDPLCAFERNHHQVLYNRVQGYRPEWLEQLLYVRRAAFEYYCNALCILPMTDLPYFRCSMQQQQQSVASGVDQEMLQAIQQVLEHVRLQGEASSKDFQTGRKIYGWWESSKDKNPRTAVEKQISDAGVMVLHQPSKGPSTKIEKQALDYLHLCGQVVISGRTGNQRAYDLPERIVPAALLEQSVDEQQARRHLMIKYLRAYGLSHLGQPGWRFGWYKAPKAEKKQLLLELVDQGLVSEVRIDGLKRTYYCPTELVPELVGTAPIPQGEAAVILAPLDNLLWDRDRLDDLFGFNYRWEVYTPAAKRQYGHYVVPLLHGDRLVGRIELRADRVADALRVDNIWFEPNGEGSLPAVRRAVELEAAYLGLAKIFGCLEGS